MNFEIMRTFLLLILANILFASASAQIWRGKDSIPQKRIVQFGAGVHSGVYKLVKENTDYKSEDIGIDIGIEARFLINLTKHFSVATGFVQSRKETKLIVSDFSFEIFNIQNIASQIPLRFNYSFYTKNHKPIIDAYFGVAGVFSKYTTVFEYIDYQQLYYNTRSTIGPYYTKSITTNRRDFSYLLGLQRSFPITKFFQLTFFAEYEYGTRAIAINTIINERSPYFPAFETNLKLRPTSLKLGTFLLF